MIGSEALSICLPAGKTFPSLQQYLIEKCLLTAVAHSGYSERQSNFPLAN